MRSSRYLNRRKKRDRRKIYKEIKNKKSRRTFNFGASDDISELDLENINEILRVHKNQRANGKGVWKVVPKDSCEVYRERQRRQIESERRERTSEEDEEDANTRKAKRKSRRRNNSKRKEFVKKPQQRHTIKRRKKRNSSLSSYSTATVSTSTTCTTFTEMDYD
ncbi:uncharacterized protein LOC131840776 [Achroia grisella]|uniref:uncharacterized protein LOC131840776 n=1 Tax=Achroia grisella TaxID=688607 RepID=UPI0027D2E086|nr:uncharacterized protein LOC131840776 [Achroia grisella]